MADQRGSQQRHPVVVQRNSMATTGAALGIVTIVCKSIPVFNLL